MNIQNTEVLTLLNKAGWYPGRDVFNELMLPEEFEIFPKAKEVLGELGGLEIGQYGHGLEYARMPVKICPREFYVEPNIVFAFMDDLTKRLFPIGELDSECLIVIDENGLTYLMLGGPSFATDELSPFGPFEQALEMFLLGIKSKLTSHYHTEPFLLSRKLCSFSSWAKKVAPGSKR